VRLCFFLFSSAREKLFLFFFVQSELGGSSVVTHVRMLDCLLFVHCYPCYTCYNAGLFAFCSFATRVTHVIMWDCLRFVRCYPCYPC
jgi:hypothetical protein